MGLLLLLRNLRNEFLICTHGLHLVSLNIGIQTAFLGTLSFRKDSGGKFHLK